MKIISGKYKGRILEGYDILGTRPTMERVKESLFATIQNKIKDSVVLDLFAGSGNLGIEALSQGANYAYLVDSNPKAIQVMKNNISKIGIQEIEVLGMDYQKALEYLKKQDISFDIIFLDPPYKTNYIEKALLVIEKYHLIKEDGFVVCESDELDKICYSSSYQEFKNKKYGDKYVVILQKI